MDVFILNTAAVDFRRDDFGFVTALAGQGGLVKGSPGDLPAYPQSRLREWIEEGCAAAGGPGNSAPLIARAGLQVAVGVNLGKGDFQGLDASGRYFYDLLVSSGVDMTSTVVHPRLATGLAFIDTDLSRDRPGIVYFPNANDDFDLNDFKPAISRLRPKIVYYMYSGLSRRADAKGGQILADFIHWCRQQDIVTLVDSHTLAGNPRQIIASGREVAEYRLLQPLLPELDLFFTSFDEAKMIANTLLPKRQWSIYSDTDNIRYILSSLSEKYWKRENRTRLLGITVGSGAHAVHTLADGTICDPYEVRSQFIKKGCTNLVGAGDSFRAGLLSYICRNFTGFGSGKFNFKEAIQMGNLFASRYITASLKDRLCCIDSYDTMVLLLRQNR